MSAIEAVISEPLDVRVCGAIRPSRGWKAGNVVRHFIASGVVAFDGRLAWLSTRENQIFNAIIADQSRSQLNTMIAFVGENDEDGGPDDILGVVQVSLLRLREKLKALDLELVRNGNMMAPLVLRRRQSARVAEVA